MFNRNKVLILIVVFAAFGFFTGVSTSFHYGNDFIVTSNRDDGNIPENYLRNDTLRVAKRYYRDYALNVSDYIYRRVKRNDDTTFYGHPKTREERWHASFNMNRTFLQEEQAKSLVNLLVKVMDKYLNACIPIVLYDNYVLSTEGVVLETFFKVNSHLSVKVFRSFST